MEEIKAMLTKLLANQLVIYKELDQMKNKEKGTFRSVQDQTYLKELEEKAEKFIPLIKLARH